MYNYVCCCVCCPYLKDHFYVKRMLTELYTQNNLDLNFKNKQSFSFVIEIGMQPFTCQLLSAHDFTNDTMCA